MKIIVTKEELLELCSHCAEQRDDGCVETCIFGDECGGAYIGFLQDNTEIKE